MGFEVLSQTCQPGQTVQFTFQNQLQSWVLGLGSFSLSYGPTTNHWIQTLSISLQGGLPERAASVGNVLEVVVQVQMMDHSGHTIDVGASIITVACVAVTGIVDQCTLLTNVPNIAPNQSPQVQLPGSGSAFTVLETCLSGLYLSYDTIDHMYQGSSASCGITLQGGGGMGVLNATANIWDSTGHQASTATIDAGVLASVDDPPGLMLRQVRAQSGVPLESQQFPSSVGQAVAVIQGFTVQYPSGNHGVQWLQVGGEIQSIGGDMVGVAAGAYTTDGDGHSSSSGESYVDLVVVAIPAPASA
jgi:hypothetical protein